MEFIMEGTRIPKVQVERAVSPILAMFIADVLSSYFKASYPHDYQLVSQEFPLKKDNSNQSKNVDYLLVNSDNDELVFVELKTDSRANYNQAENYIKVKESVKQKSAKVLSDNLHKIRASSNKKHKYDYAVDKFNARISDPGQINDLLIVYIVPRILKGKYQAFSDKIDHVLSFEDLPEMINNSYPEEWKIIRNSLTQLDENYKGTAINKEFSLEKLINNVENFAEEHGLQPVGIKFGNTGEMKRPNYQIRFSDGRRQAFHSGGKVWRGLQWYEFNSHRLNQEESWDPFVKRVINGNSHLNSER